MYPDKLKIIGWKCLDIERLELSVQETVDELVDEFSLVFQ